jgi:hypothetical protein
MKSNQGATFWRSTVGRCKHEKKIPDMAAGDFRL